MSPLLSLRRHLIRRKVIRCDWNGGGGNEGFEKRVRLLKTALEHNVSLEGYVRVPTGRFLGSTTVPAIPWFLTSIYLSQPGVGEPLIRYSINKGYRCENLKGWDILSHLLSPYSQTLPNIEAFRLVIENDDFWLSDTKKRSPDTNNPKEWIIGKMGSVPPLQFPKFLQLIQKRPPAILASMGITGLMKSLCRVGKKMEEESLDLSEEAQSKKLDDLDKAGHAIANWASQTFSNEWWFGGPDVGILVRSDDITSKAPSLATRVFLAPFMGFCLTYFEELRQIRQTLTATSETAGKVQLDKEFLKKSPWITLSPGIYEIAEVFKNHDFYKSCFPVTVMKERMTESLPAPENKGFKKSRL